MDALEIQFMDLCTLAERVGVKPPLEQWQLTRGEGDYLPSLIPYRIVRWTESGRRTLPYVTGTDMLGMSAAEAREAMSRYRLAWLAVLAVRDDAGEASDADR